MDKKYQVFISSTFADLEDERQGVMEAILKADCFPAGMEMFPAADLQQFEYIKKIIDQSDYYVLIIAGRYGTLADDGKSYTQKEYEYAIEKGIPVLAFIKKDIDNLLVRQTDDNHELKEKLLEFRRKITENALVNYWDNKDELKYKVLDSLVKAFSITPRVGWVKGDTIIKIENNGSKGLSENRDIKTAAHLIKNDLKICFRDIFKMLVRYSITNSNLTIERSKRIGWITEWKEISREFQYSEEWRKELRVLINVMSENSFNNINDIYVLLDQTKKYNENINKSNIKYDEFYKSMEMIPKEKIFNDRFIKNYNDLRYGIDEYDDYCKKFENTNSIKDKEYYSKVMNSEKSAVYKNSDFFRNMDKQDGMLENFFYENIQDEWKQIFNELEQI